jgi:membrane protein YdbS with pleckstrin-like domain
VSWTPVSPRLAALRRRVTLIVAVVALVLGAMLLLLIGADPLAAWLGGLTAVVVPLAALSWRACARTVAAWGYTEREDDLLIRSGVLMRRLVVVPYGRMQFVDVGSGPLARSFGVATVQLHTASAATDARIPGLDPAEAARLRDRLASLGEAQAAGL